MQISKLTFLLFLKAVFIYKLILLLTQDRIDLCDALTEHACLAHGIHSVGKVAIRAITEADTHVLVRLVVRTLLKVLNLLNFMLLFS